MVNKTLITLNLTTKTSQKLSTKKRSFGYTVHLIGLHATVALLCVPVLFVLVYIMKAVALLLFAHATEVFFDLVLPVTACAFAVCVATLANPMHALLALVGVFLATVLFYVNSGIVFIGLVFLIVYVGAVAILFLFVIMLLNVKSLTSKEPLLTHPTQAVALFFGALLSYRLFADIAVSLGRTTFGTALQRSHAGNTVTSVDEKIYHEVMYKSADANAIAPLYTEHLLPFCLTTANLALSLFGAIVLAASTTEQTVKLVPAPATSRLVDAPRLPLSAKLSPPLLRRGPVVRSAATVWATLTRVFFTARRCLLLLARYAG